MYFSRCPGTRLFQTEADMAIDIELPNELIRFSTAVAMAMSWCGTEPWTPMYDVMTEMEPPRPISACELTRTAVVGRLVA